MSKVQAYYDGVVDREWERLSRQKLEFGTTTRVLARFLEPGWRVLDAGAGPGRYSFHLAERGFTDAFLVRPDAISPFMARFPLEELLVTAAEGLPGQTDKAIYDQGDAALEAALDIIERTGSDPLTWGASDHFLYVGRRS